MKTENMISTNGNKVANQFIINDDNGNTFFQSYRSVIVKLNGDEVELDQHHVGILLRFFPVKIMSHQIYMLLWVRVLKELHLKSIMKYQF